MGALHLLQPLYSGTGFAVGVLVGLTGVGGGSLMTPILILLFGIHPATAVGTDLLYAAVTKTAGSAVHEKATPTAPQAHLIIPAIGVKVDRCET